MRALHVLMCHDDHDQRNVDHRWWCWQQVKETDHGIWCEFHEEYVQNPSKYTHRCPGPHREAVIVTGSLIEKEPS